MFEVLLILAGAVGGGGAVAWIRREPGDTLLQAIIRPLSGPRPTKPRG